MNSKTKKLAAGLALLALVPGAALAHTDVSIGLNLGGGYYAPAPVYVAPPPPPPVYYRPAPVYYGPAVRVDGYYDGYRREWCPDDGWRDRGWRHGHGRWHDRDDD